MSPSESEGEEAQIRRERSGDEIDQHQSETAHTLMTREEKENRPTKTK